MAAKKQRPSMDDIFDDGGAISKLTGGSPNMTRTENVPPTEPEVQGTDLPDEEKKKGGGQQRKIKPTSFYIPPEQLGHLDELVFYHNRRTGQRINRNDIVRHLIAKSRLEDLEGLIEENQE